VCCRRNLISGHIPSYGGTSRGGAGLLSSETDHIGFHTRHLKDFSLLYNYMRTGIDPLDGDTVAIEMKNPAQMDLSTIKVLIVEGDFAWAYNNETGSWGYAPGSVPASYGGLSAWKWPERVERIKGALSAAGIPYETKNMTEMAAAFEAATLATPQHAAATLPRSPLHHPRTHPHPRTFQDFSLDPLYPDPSIGRAHAPPPLPAALPHYHHPPPSRPAAATSWASTRRRARRKPSFRSSSCDGVSVALCHRCISGYATVA